MFFYLVVLKSWIIIIGDIKWSNGIYIYIIGFNRTFHTNRTTKYEQIKTRDRRTSLEAISNDNDAPLYGSSSCISS